MGICRDTFGALSYTATNSKKHVFSITKHYGGPYTIRKHEPWYTTDAMIMIDSEMAFWDDTPKFDSFIKAVRYLKENLEYLF